MNKTIYLRDEEAPVWERARELAGDKLSPVIVAALKQFIVTKEAEMAGFERIEVSFPDSEQHGFPKRKAFHGRWVFSPQEPLEVDDEQNPETYCWAVAVTQKGSAVFYTWSENQQDDSRYRFRFAVYPSLEAAAENGFHAHAARMAIEKIGVPVEELDI